MLTPTRIYVKSCLAAMRETKALKGLAHITGGGFPDNIPRVLPEGAGVALDLARVPVLPVFKWLAATGGIAEPEMLRTFNCGIGMIAIVDAGGADAITDVLDARRRNGRAARQGHRGRRRRTTRRLFRPPRPRVTAMAKKRVAILISGRGSNMASLIAAAKDDSYPAEIALVLSNRPDAPGLASAKSQGIATAVVDHTHYGKDREAFERALQDALIAHRIDLVCLAGFMRLLTPWFVGQWQGRMLNIHPALLPAFKGLHTHERALEAGVKTHGATVHFVSPEMDSGEIIAAGGSAGAVRRYAGHAGRARARSRAPDLSAGAAAGGRERSRLNDKPLAQRGRARDLADDLVAGKELGDLFRRRVRRVRTMDGVFADRLGVHLADRIRGSLGRIGRPHDVAVAHDRVVAFQHLNDDRPGDHEGHELAEERTLAMHRVERLRLLAGDPHALLRDDAQPRLLDHGVDGAGQIARGRVGLEDGKSAFDCHWKVFSLRSR